MAKHLSRRQLLTAAGLTLGAAWVEVAGLSSAAQAAPSGDPALELVPDRPVEVLAPDGSAPHLAPRQLGVRILNDGGPLAPGTKVTVAYDRRLYAALTTPVVTLGARDVRSTSVTGIDSSTGLATCTITLGEHIPARSPGTGELVALIGTADQRRYPYDMVARPADPAAAVGPAARRTLRPARRSAPGPAVLPWGVEVAGRWARVTWGADDSYWYYVPSWVSVAGTGPGRSPAATFAVTADPRIVAGMRVVAARLNDKPYPLSRVTVEDETSTSSLRQVRWRTRARLGARDRLDVELRVVTRKPAGRLDTITHPVVSTSLAAQAGARQTGRMSVSRADSRWE